MNLAGVERVLEMEETMDAMQAAHGEPCEREMLTRIDAVHRSYKRELVRWEPPSGSAAARSGETETMQA